MSGWSRLESVHHVRFEQEKASREGSVDVRGGRGRRSTERGVPRTSGAGATEATEAAPRAHRTLKKHKRAEKLEKSRKELCDGDRGKPAASRSRDHQRAGSCELTGKRLPAS